MEKVVKVFPASRWPMIQNLMLSIIGLVMFLVLKRSGWDVSTGISLATSAVFCCTFFRGVQRRSREATTAKERLDANWRLMEFTVAVVSVLVVCLTLLHR